MSDVRVYRPNQWSEEKALWPRLLEDLISGRELGYRLFRRDVSARYRQSLLGPAWVVIFPLFTVGVFVLLNTSGVLQVRDAAVPYPAFALFGLILWTLFSGLVSSLSGVIAQTGSLVTKIRFPRIALAVSPVLTSILELLIRLVLLGILLAGYGVVPDPAALLLPVFLLPVLLLGIGAGLFLSIPGGVFKDIPNFLSLFFTVLLFATPVMYPMPEEGVLREINRYNPLYYLIQVPRDLFFEGRFEQGIPYAASVLLSILLFLGGWRFYQVAMNRIVEKI